MHPVVKATMGLDDFFTPSSLILSDSNNRGQSIQYNKAE
jgi:hypothetical protein